MYDTSFCFSSQFIYDGKSYDWRYFKCLIKYKELDIRISYLIFVELLAHTCQIVTLHMNEVQLLPPRFTLKEYSTSKMTICISMSDCDTMNLWRKHSISGMSPWWTKNPKKANIFHTLKKMGSTFNNSKTTNINWQTLTQLMQYKPSLIYLVICSVLPKHFCYKRYNIKHFHIQVECPVEHTCAYESHLSRL